MMQLDRLTVTQRLSLGFGLMLLTLVALTLLAMQKVNAIDEALLANSERDAVIQRYAINFRGSAHDRSIAIRDVVLAATPADRQREVAAIDRLAAFYASAAGPLEKMLAAPGAAPELAPLYAAIREIEARTVATTRQIIDRVDAQDVAQAQQLLWTQAKPQYEQWLAAINKLIDAEEARIQGANQRALREAGGFVTVMLSLLALALPLGVALAWMLSRSILNQLGAEPAVLGAAARRVARGDLGPVPGAQQAPAGSVLASLGAMQSDLARVVGLVRGSSDAIASRSEDIAHGNTDLSQRTETQAAALQQTAASMEELGAAVRQNAESARQANDLARGASDVATRGGDVFGEVVATMKGIDTSAKQIAEIIGVIDGIAFQTNILALNAAVEAARAGEQGRGFAVVASEVRALAQRSATAAREIKTLITASVERAEQGSVLVGQAGATMSEVVSAIRRVTEIMAEISAASAEQRSGVEQVGAAVVEMDRATQQNAALVDQSAAAAEGLRQQAAQLVQAVAVFQVGGATPAAA